VREKNGVGKIAMSAGDFKGARGERDIVGAKRAESDVGKIDHGPMGVAEPSR
jgi:hypothetical protein